MAFNVLFKPDIKIKFQVQCLDAAYVRRSTWNQTYDIQDVNHFFSHEEVSTQWIFNVQEASQARQLMVNLSTFERINSLLHQSSSRPSQAPEQGPPWSVNVPSKGLSHVHPAFNLHRKIAYSLQNSGDESEATALHLLQLSYDEEDRRRPQNRIYSMNLAFKRTTRDDKFNPVLFTQIALSRERYKHIKSTMRHDDLPLDYHRAFIALGSNIGDRISKIEQACREMNINSIQVTRTSALYETKPMYFEDQQPFINGVCEVR